MRNLQDKMLSMDQIDIATIHRFAEGIYSREITIPKGVCLVGATHKTQHFFIISKGCCVFNGGVELTAPYQGITEVGTKRSIFAIDETVMTTFHVTNETNIDQIERDIIESEGLNIQNNTQKVLR